MCPSLEAPMVQALGVLCFIRPDNSTMWLAGGLGRAAMPIAGAEWGHAATIGGEGMPW